VAVVDHGPRGGPLRVRLRLPDGWRADPAETLTTMAGRGAVSRLRFRVTTPSRLDPGSHDLGVELSRGSLVATQSMRVVEAPGSDPWRLYAPATLRVQVGRTHH
jgi:hypothetical protein